MSRSQQDGWTVAGSAPSGDGAMVGRAVLDRAAVDRTTVERATAADADAIRTVEGLSGSTLRLLDRDLASSDRCCLVARVDGEVVGYAAGLLQVDEGHVLDLAVRATARRGGVGHLLLVALLVELRHLGAAAATLEVRPSNAAALALYARSGFVAEGRRPGYYPDGEDALLLWRRDLSALAEPAPTVPDRS